MYLDLRDIDVRTWVTFRVCTGYFWCTWWIPRVSNSAKHGSKSGFWLGWFWLGLAWLGHDCDWAIKPTCWASCDFDWAIKWLGLIGVVINNAINAPEPIVVLILGNNHVKGCWLGFDCCPFKGQKWLLSDHKGFLEPPLEVACRWWLWLGLILIWQSRRLLWLAADCDCAIKPTIVIGHWLWAWIMGRNFDRGDAACLIKWVGIDRESQSWSMFGASEPSVIYLINRILWVGSGARAPRAINA